MASLILRLSEREAARSNGPVYAFLLAADAFAGGSCNRFVAMPRPFDRHAETCMRERVRGHGITCRCDDCAVLEVAEYLAGALGTVKADVRRRFIASAQAVLDRGPRRERNQTREIDAR